MGKKKADLVKKDLEKLKDEKKALVYQRFFKTGPGEYGEGDIFLGIIIPDQRKIAKKYGDLSLKEIQKLLQSQIHEHRVVGLMILGDQYRKKKKEGNKRELKKIVDFYLKNLEGVNNWDLVDGSAPGILGDYLLDEKDRKILYRFAKSKNLWEKRIAILSTLTFIKERQFEDTLKITEILLSDDHDLIHKAVGWMLREVGKQDQEIEEKFLRRYHRTMPRTMLRYAIERFSPAKRKFYLAK